MRTGADPAEQVPLQSKSHTAFGLTTQHCNERENQSQGACFESIDDHAFCGKRIQSHPHDFESPIGKHRSTIERSCFPRSSQSPPKPGKARNAQTRPPHSIAKEIRLPPDGNRHTPDLGLLAEDAHLRPSGARGDSKWGQSLITPSPTQGIGGAEITARKES
jgi:hypothetical protein